MEDDPETDLFQIGRDPTNNDFRIIGKGTGEQTTSVSRLAFRILCNRTDPTDIRIYAAGFDGNGLPADNGSINGVDVRLG